LIPYTVILASPIAETAFMNRTEHCPSLLRKLMPLWVGAAVLSSAGLAHAVNYPITPEQRGTAEQVAQAGVPLSELAPNAPDSHTVQRGDTLWDISKLFLRSPWRWPELWGMNMDQVRNPHLIYPGQILYLVKVGDRATLRMAKPGDGGGASGEVPTGTVKLSPRVRSDALDGGAIPSIPLHLIGPFLNEAVVFSTDELQTAPRIVASQEGRVLLSRGETAYVRGDLKGVRDFRVFRDTKPLVDPGTGETLGFEARYVGTAEFVRDGGMQATLDGQNTQIVPATFRMTSIRLEAGIGDRLAPTPEKDYSAYVPHAPARPIAGQIVSIYGEALSAGQNQIVTINRGARDGMERGHVLALWRDGSHQIDRTDSSRPLMKLPDERIGVLFVFRIFERVSYALIIQSQDPVKPGDRFTQP
jgi:LysM domain